MGRKLPRFIGTVAVVFASFAAHPQQRGECVRVDVPSTMTLPDGSLHAAGTLTLCTTERLTPVTVMHTLSVDGAPLGLYASRIVRSEGADLPHPVVAFLRNEAGILELTGYAAGAPWAVSFQFGPARGSRRQKVPAAVPRETSREPNDLVRIAAR